MELLVDAHEFVDRLQALLPAGLLEEVGEALLVVGIHEHNVEVVAFLEFEEDVGAVFAGEEHGLWGFPVLFVAHLADVLLGG